MPWAVFIMLWVVLFIAGEVRGASALLTSFALIASQAAYLIWLVVRSRGWERPWPAIVLAIGPLLGLLWAIYRHRPAPLDTIQLDACLWWMAVAWVPAFLIFLIAVRMQERKVEQGRVRGN